MLDLSDVNLHDFNLSWGPESPDGSASCRVLPLSAELLIPISDRLTCQNHEHEMKKLKHASKIL